MELHLLSPLLPLLTLLLCFCASATDVFFEDAVEDGAYLRREHSLTKPYHGEQVYDFLLK